MNHRFEVKDKLYLDGEPFQIISGAIHYYRVVPEYWRDRLEKLKAMGCNTVETYVAWNVHEPRENEFCFEGIADLGRFIRTAGELGLWVIVRPSPYICAEWEFGGFPSWLLTKPGIRLRTDNPVYMDCVTSYYKELFKILTPLQCTKGGPIILMQVENEYGSYGTDKEYLKHLASLMRENGAEVPFFTADGPRKEMMDKGTMEGVWATANFGSNTKDRFQFLKEYIGNQPLMCMEFWAGWFDHWGGEKHMTSDLEQNVKDLDEMLQQGNVNFYMFHGGTNFGFMNGSNYASCLTPDTTSYDYDAVLSEDGCMTEKYFRFRDVISKYTEIPEVEFTTKIKRKAYGNVQADKKVSLFSVLDDLSTPVHSQWTQSMEEVGQDYGFILYRTKLGAQKDFSEFKIMGGGDRANIFADEKQIEIRYDKELEKNGELHLEREGAQFDILMENLGRVNYGPQIEDQKKGITKGVWFNWAFQNGWDIYPLPLNNIEKVDFSKEYKEGPAFYHFELTVDELADTFLELPGFGHGCVFINGKNLGRFWEIGPQKRLYIPAPLLREGKNEIIVFETDGKAGDGIRFEEEPLLS